jgi:hypothetical protein
MSSLDAETVTHALEDSDAYVRNAGLRGAEPFLAKGDAAIQAAVLKKADDSNWQVRRQLAATLGELPRETRVTQVVAMFKKYGSDQITVDAGISGLKGQEADALTQLVAESNANADAVEMLAGAAAKSREAGQMEKADCGGYQRATAGQAAACNAQRRQHRSDRRGCPPQQRHVAGGRAGGVAACSAGRARW